MARPEPELGGISVFEDSDPFYHLIDTLSLKHMANSTINE